MFFSYVLTCSWDFLYAPRMFLSFPGKIITLPNSYYFLKSTDGRFGGSCNSEFFFPVSDFLFPVGLDPQFLKESLRNCPPTGKKNSLAQILIIY